jgi:hypothetical protein
MTAEGARWACGRRAFIALWGVQSWLTDHRTSATSTSQAFGVSSACMSAYRRYLSPACRAVFYGGQKKKMRRR